MTSLSRLSGMPTAVLCLIATSAAITPRAAAQEAEPDTSVVDVPTSVSPADSVRPARKIIAFDPIATYPPATGTRIDSVLPARRVAFRFVDYLSSEGPVFLYDLGASGWPHGVSIDGVSPNFVALSWSGVDYDNPLTGRPQFEMIALGAIHAPSIARAETASAAAVVVEPRSFDQPHPLSEIYYRTDSAGLQAISATHSQSRLRTIGSSPARIGFLFNYGGEGSSNEYPGSRLRRARRAYIRASVTTNGLSISVFEVYNRRRIGAHSGVVAPSPGNFNSIYQRLGASVLNDAAIRDDIRNDLGAVVRASIFGTHPITLIPSWTHGNFSFRDRTDSVSTNFNRYALRIEQDATIGNGTLRFYGNVFQDRFAASTAFADSVARSRTEVRAGFIDTLRFGTLDLVSNAGVYSDGDAIEPVLSMQAATRIRPVGLSLQAGRRPLRLPAVMMHGYANRLVVPKPVALPIQSFANARTSFNAGVFDIAITGYAGHTTDYVDLYMTEDPDSAVVLSDSVAFDNFGVAIEAGYRRHKGRGVYLTGRASYYHADATGSPSPKRELALPDYEFTGTIGVRYVVFKGDLDFDLSVRSRFWPTFSSRTMHPATGLLAIPYNDQVSAPSSSALDLVFEARIRTATVLVGYDNFLSGTTIVAGNLITPVYPLAERRLRFGVYWPIKN